MRLEIPTVRRCCFCVPLRNGIAILGYLNLLFGIFVLCLESYLVSVKPSTGNIALYRGVSFFCQVWVTLALYAAEVIFSVVLVIGAHMKKPKLLRVYYYYSITTTLATLVLFLVVSYDEIFKDYGYFIIESSVAFCGFVFQVYLLLLIRSELKRIKERSQLSFVNHVSEVIIDAPLGQGRNPL